MTAFAIAQAQKILDKQSFSRMLGTELLEFGDGRAVLALNIRLDHTQQNGFAHGGILAYLVDNAITFAAGTVLGPQLLTAGMGVEYLRPATGPRLIATAVVTASTRRRAVASCTISDDGQIVAVGQGTAQLLDAEAKP